MLRALSNQDKPETIMNAIECGDVGGLKKGLEKFPDAVSVHNKLCYSDWH